MKRIVSTEFVKVSFTLRCQFTLTFPFLRNRLLINFKDIVERDGNNKINIKNETPVTFFLCLFKTQTMQNSKKIS